MYNVSRKHLFWKFKMPKFVSWSMGQKKLMSENAFFPNMPPSLGTGPPSQKLRPNLVFP